MGKSSRILSLESLTLPKLRKSATGHAARDGSHGASGEHATILATNRTTVRSLLLLLLVHKQEIAAVDVKAPPKSRPTFPTAQASMVLLSCPLRLKPELVLLSQAPARTGLNGVLTLPVLLPAELFSMTEPLLLEPSALLILKMPVDCRSESAAAISAMLELPGARMRVELKAKLVCSEIAASMISGVFGASA